MDALVSLPLHSQPAESQSALFFHEAIIAWINYLLEDTKHYMSSLLAPCLVRHKAIILKGFLLFPCSHSHIRLACYEAAFSSKILLGLILFIFLSSLISVKMKTDKRATLRTNKKSPSFQLTMLISSWRFCAQWTVIVFQDPIIKLIFFYQTFYNII